MTIDIKRNGNEITLVPVGRLDTTTAPALDKTIQEELDGMNYLILDMNGLEYISSAGLRVLLGAQKKMGSLGGMKLVGVCEEVMDVFAMTGFADILTIE